MHAVLAQPRASTEYADLKRQVQALGLLRRQPGYYTAKFAAIAALLSIAGVGLVLADANPWLRLLDAAFLAFVFGQIGLLAHDLSHQQIVGAGRANTVLGLIYVAVAAFLGLKGRDRIQAATPPVPEQTVDTVKEDVEWAKTRAQSAKR